MALRVSSFIARGPDLASVTSSLHAQVMPLRPSALLWLTDGGRAQCLADAMATCSDGSAGAVTQAGLIGDGEERTSVRDEFSAVAMAITLPSNAEVVPFHSTPDGLPELPAETWAEYAAAPPERSPHLLLVAAPPRVGSFPLERWLSMMDGALPWAKKVGGLTAGGDGELYMGTRRFDGGAVGLALQGVEMEARSFQGAVPVGPSHEVTHCDGNLIHALDGQPVGAVLGETIESFMAQPTERTLMCGISVPARAPAARRGAEHTPAQHEYVVRQLLGFSRTQSVLAVGASPELLTAPGTRVQLHAFSAETARSELSRRMPRHDDLAGGLMVSCLGRGEALFGQTGVETAAFKAAHPNLSLTGLFAGGEIGPVGARTFVHTYSTTVGLLRPR